MSVGVKKNETSFTLSKAVDTKVYLCDFTCVKRICVQPIATAVTQGTMESYRLSLSLSCWEVDTERSFFFTFREAMHDTFSSIFKRRQEQYLHEEGEDKRDK